MANTLIAPTAQANMNHLAERLYLYLNAIEVITNKADGHVKTYIYLSKCSKAFASKAFYLTYVSLPFI